MSAAGLVLGATAIVLVGTGGCSSGSGAASSSPAAGSTSSGDDSSVGADALLIQEAAGGGDGAPASSGDTSDGGRAGDASFTDALADAAGTTSWWHPPVTTTFYWDLQNAPPDNTKDVGAYDIDGWNNDAAEVSKLHALGIKVVCYMDAGTWEPGRPDSSAFPANLKGSAVSGWPGELWLDVRPSGPSYATLQSIMLARFQVCRSKGFDAVEPDNVDSYQNAPGFPTTAGDQIAYDEWIAETAHSLGLAVFQKNDLDQIATLLPHFDGLLDEECNKYSECALLGPYVHAGKPAWNAEYTEDGETTAQFCAADVDAGIVGALFSIKLDGSLFLPCADDVGKIN